MNSDETNIYSRLAPFIREYIYKNNWTELRKIQIEACKVIFNTENHLLLASGTASGKTEAAFLPVLTRIYEEPPASVGVLYIAPLKALINDQFLRINDLLTDAGIPVRHWHGDVSKSLKDRFLREPSGILQITPESLESLVINRSRDLIRIFGDLRFVIIDEVHAFMNSDRGTQVLCLLERISRYIRSTPRRIGLSATISDTESAGAWLSSGTTVITEVPHVTAPPQKIRLAVEHFQMPVLEDNKNPLEEPSLKYIYEKSLGKKCIIFTNGREGADGIIANMRFFAETYGTPDIYHVHHGSISSPLREVAETDMKELPGPVVTGATLTLEMGIDVGKLERIIQAGAPVSVSSLVQRLGRSGRRDNPPEMWFVDWETFGIENSSLPYKIPWRLIQIIAMLQLYLEERWIEPPRILKYPCNILYHQTMSIVAASGELTFEALTTRVLGLSRFFAVSSDDFSDLVKHLICIDHLQATEEGGLIIGLEGAKVTENFGFYAVFPEEEEWAVMNNSNKIGCIEDPVPPGEYITVGGLCWQVSEVDNKRRLVFVKPTKRLIRFFWHGDRALLHNRILERMRQVLFEDTDYPYLHEKAKLQLKVARNIAKEADMDKQNLYVYHDNSLGCDICCIFPWMGHIAYHTLLRILKNHFHQNPGVDRFSGASPYFITVRLNGKTKDYLLEEIKNIFDNTIKPENIFSDHDIRNFKKECEYKVPKYDCFVPDNLLRKQLIYDYIDLDFLREETGKWR